jgi:hypothetical protein
MNAIDIAVQNAPRSWAYTVRPGAVGSSPASLILRRALTRIAEKRYHADGQGSFITADVDFETVTEN